MEERKRKASGQVEKEPEQKRAGGSGGSASVQRTVYSKETLLQMQVARLKAILHEKKLPISGKKADLVDRILEHQ